MSVFLPPTLAVRCPLPLRASDSGACRVLLISPYLDKNRDFLLFSVIGIVVKKSKCQVEFCEYEREESEMHFCGSVVGTCEGNVLLSC